MGSSPVAVKYKYALHYRNPELFLSLGMELAKFHRALKFKPSDWLKKHIEFNMGKRKNVANSFEKYFFKLVNSTFGKTMKSLKKIINVRLVNNAEDYKRNISKPSFVSLKIFSKNFVAIREIRPSLTLERLIYVGFSILDLSKFLMYEFHYKCIKRKYAAKLLLTDAGNLVYEIKTGDVYKDFYGDKNLFDFSDYPQDSRFLDHVSKKAISKMKYELKKKII